MDEPTTLPEGTGPEVCVAEAKDEVDSKERVALKEALAESWSAARAGRMRPAGEFPEILGVK